MSKFYAVKKGKHPGIYLNWADCQREVSGYSGAIYKSFPTLEEAKKWLAGKKASVSKLKSYQQTDLFQEEVKLPSIFLYTDGGSRNHGNKLGQHVKASDKAAWAFLIQKAGQTYTGTGGKLGATNNRMELMALRNALQELLDNGWNHEVIVATLDSHYVLDPIVKGWLRGWQRRDWKTSTGSAVANQELWQEIVHLLPQFSNLHFKWTKGHATNKGNVSVDELLNRTMDRMEEK